MQTKVCTKCGKEKPLNEFYREKRGLYGRRSDCKACRRIYSQTPARKEYQKRLSQSDHCKEYQKHYCRSEKHRERNKRYAATEKGKMQHRHRIERYYAKHPEHRQAINAVNHAIRNGSLPAPHILKCQQCGGPAQQYHHFLGYDQAHFLSVIPLCRQCHEDTHHIA